METRRNVRPLWHHDDEPRPQPVVQAHEEPRRVLALAGHAGTLLLQSGAAAAQRTGSGSAVFGLYRTGEQAQAAARSLSRQRWAVFCHSTEGEEAAW